MTFAKHYADWKGLFAGNGMLFPKEMTGTPEAFNTGFRDAPPPSAGPFVITNIDRGAQRITLGRNPKWWGTPPLLDGITYSVLDDAARIPALLNKSLDASGLASLPELTTRPEQPRHRDPAGASASWYHLTFNGPPAPSSPTRRCGRQSRRASTGRPSPTSPRTASWTSRSR